MLPRALAVLSGALLLLWPAFLNGYPLLFSDTGAFLHQTLGPLMIWDKPYVYGPILHAFHWRVTLWLPLLAQGLVLSHLLWLTTAVLRGTANPALHVLLCGALALCTTAPWSAALLMPDILAPVALLSLYLLGFGTPHLTRGQMSYLALVATLAIAAHLSHLPLAATLVVLTLVLTRALRPTLRVAAPLAAALALLLVTNLLGHGRAAVSPYGATFLLARLIADGPAARTIAAECPTRGWYLCAWAARLPADSDSFLWAAESPVNRDAAGGQRFLGGALLAPEAREIVGETLRREPGAVARAIAQNALTQLVTTQAGDTLVPDWLNLAVRPRIAQGFPARELAAYDAALQPRGAFAAAAAPFAALHLALLVLGLLALPWALARAMRQGDARLTAFLLCVLLGIAANAVATGGLSKPHHRYQARIAWLVPFAAMVALLPRRVVR